MTIGKTSPVRLRAREREQRALALRLEGKDYRTIAAEMNIPVSSAYKAVERAMRALTERISENAEQLRRLELERLEALHAALWQSALDGNLAAVDRILRIMERRARLFGLDAPQKNVVEADAVVIQFEEMLQHE